MSTKKYDSFKDVRVGKYDWKVQARVLNMWRGFSKTGEPFKGFNMLLLDSKKARMHAFVPYNIADECESILQSGAVYYIENFTVKKYKTEEKFRCIRNDIQIIFNTDTILKPIEESDVAIEKCWFDFYDLADLRSLTKQNTYLTDVIGVMEEHDPIGKIKNVNGVIQSQMKFNITDGSQSVQVTFWDAFAELFAEMLEGNLEYPRVLIIGSARVTSWKDEVILTNVGATSFYINCNHRSVIEMRKMIAQNMFSTRKLCIGGRRAARFHHVKDIQNLGEAFIESEILCYIRITSFHQMKTWCNTICTSCYEKVEVVDNADTCNFCKRIVPYAEKRFEVNITATDGTGSMHLILEDREVRTIIGRTVSQLIHEGNKVDIFPVILNSMLNQDYTVKVKLTEENIHKKSNMFLATDIMHGFYGQSLQQQQISMPHPLESMEAQASASTNQMGSASTSTVHLASDD